ncbi:hypothetical protein BH23ACT5_BH23ACT5_13740 [soil metagenome]
MDVLLEVVAPEALLTRARELAVEISSKPAHALRLTKRLLRHARMMDLDGFLELTAALQGLSHANPDHADAVASYLERWRPGRP